MGHLVLVPLLFVVYAVAVKIVGAIVVIHVTNHTLDRLSFDNGQTQVTANVHAAIIHTTVVRLPGLRRQRLLVALTQDQLATRASIRRQTIVRLEQDGEATPTTVRKLADALGCTPAELYTADQ